MTDPVQTAGDWGELAACKGRAHILEGNVWEAKTLCLGDRNTGKPACPVLLDCTRWVMPLTGRRDPGAAVYAGMTEQQRHKARYRAAGYKAKATRQRRELARAGSTTSTTSTGD